MDWKLKKENDIPDKALAEKYHPVVLGILAGRGITEEKEIEKYFSFDYEKDLQDPFEISGMDKAVARLSEAKEKKEKVAIYGDYDADGVTASAVLHEAFSEIGLRDVICYIPDRQTEGYGINEKAVGYLHDEKVDLIVTVDCGISNAAEVEKAKELGMDVIVSDHHQIPEKLPAAVAVINPHLEKSGFPDKNLAGVGVAFKLALAAAERLAPEKREQLKWMLDLVAIGTIADCVPLLGENRTLVKYGLIVLSKTRRTGLLEMFQVGRIEISENRIPDTRTVAFQVAPRINAAGRMDHANAAYKLLIEKEPAAARDLALDLEDKNQKRQKVTGEIFRDVQVLAQNSFKDKKLICAENEHWPTGVLGLVAGKITESFKKPSLIMQKKENEYTGSLRSIPEVNIMQVIRSCSDLVEKFGGHSQAAGVSVRPENLEKFWAKMSEEVEKELAGKEISKVLEIDAEISSFDIDLGLINDLKNMEPFGQGNVQPFFCSRSFTVCDLKIVGNGQKHLKLSLRGEEGSPKIFDAIGFSLAEKFPELKKDDKIDIVYNLEEDEWNGNKKIQLKLVDLKMSA